MHVDIILDATDNFDTRQLINDFAYKHQIPWIYGGVYKVHMFRQRLFLVKHRVLIA